MTSFYGGLTASIVVLSLFIGVVSHAARPAALDEALRAHGVLGPRLRRFAAAVVPFAEGALGVGGAAALLTGHQRGLQAVLALGIALFGLYAGYTRHVLALGRGGPCGCSHQDVPLSRWVTRRAVALAGLALAGAALAKAGPVQLSTAELVTLLLAAPACTVLLWSLPAAMHEPAPASVPRPARAAVHQPTETTAHRSAEGVSTRWTSPPAL
ncbi:MauE/DoxX family redox-associated membrane protein [Streptomyces sp. NP-1717]|uniref:MauE/DoxX family redox-associated membrane protein n=1 Tax=Streptomyces sp. NP-1717 TaxID=2704470 RepID=UPI001F5CC62E|nr:MauE/DoxX family redox-associated membrane protein [Streptomyces sp. NP-1717]MCI3221787.1 methylamine utilization protein MauE [Streptomyces sp. NP-1717]